MGGLFPGAASLDDFWNHVEQGIDVCREVPPGRWPVPPESILSKTPGISDSVFNRRGCFIEGFVPDLSGSGLPSEIAGSLDPMFHYLIRAGKMAFAQAALSKVDRNRVGVIVGNIALPTSSISALAQSLLLPIYEKRILGEKAGNSSIPFEPLNRFVTGLPASILAKSLGLGGGAYALDAACASSLYAVKLACDELLAGRADAMLAGGLSRADSLYTQVGFTQLRALSVSGCCSPFDAKGDGLVVGEGAGVVVLKRLEDALQDQDAIQGLICGVGLSNDLEGTLLLPSSEGQLRALRHAYAQAGWTPEMVDLIECHATGTPVGDAVEFESLSRLWNSGKTPSHRCVLSAVKSNIGHLLTGAGSAGLIQVLLSIRNKKLPPVAHFQKPSEKIKLHGSPFRILSQSDSWEARGSNVPRRAAVNGFGFGGINAHLLVEEWIGQKELPARKRAKKQPVAPNIAIVGMGVHAGKWKDLNSFCSRVLGGAGEDKPVTRPLWRNIKADEMTTASGAVEMSFPGWYLEDLSIPMDRFHISPRELAEMLPQQLLMLDTVRMALADAQNPKLAPDKTGVFIGLGLDLRTTDFQFRWTAREKAPIWAKALGLDSQQNETQEWMAQAHQGAGPELNSDRTVGALGGLVASRIAREYHSGGPSHTVCSEETSGIRALEVAIRALQSGEIDTALAGAVDLNGDIRSLAATHLIRPWSQKGTARPFDSDADGAVPGEGAAAVVLKRLEDARRDGDRVYAVIRGFGVAGGERTRLRGSRT